MQRYALRRLFAAAVVVMLVSVLVFSLMRLLPGDALLTKLGETGRVPPEQLEQLRADMGLDDPLPVQYGNWVLDIFDGSMGESLIYDGQSVSSRIGDALPVTLELGVLAIVAAILIGVPLGVLSAITQDTPLDYVMRIFSMAGLSLPAFWIGLIVIIYGTLYFGYSAPSGGWTPFLEDPVENLSQLWIPALILGYSLAANIMRMTRSTVLEAFHQDYVRTARSKGVNERIVVWRHVLRNALIPVITLVGIQARVVFSGALVLEVLFQLPGMGQLTYQAVFQRDYTQIQGNTLVIATFIVLINLLVDLSYGYIDPRIRYA